MPRPEMPTKSPHHPGLLKPSPSLGFWKNQDGTTMIEMAVVLPTFCLLLAGFFEFSIVLFGYSNATFAARAGARLASVSSSSSVLPCNATVMQTLVNSYLYAAPSGGVTTTTTWTPGNIVGGTVNVTVKIVYPIGVPLLNLTQITVGSSAQRTITR